MDPAKKRIHPSGSSKRHLAASKALKQAAADPKQRTLTLYTPLPSVNEGDYGDFSSSTGTGSADAEVEQSECDVSRSVISESSGDEDMPSEPSDVSCPVSPSSRHFGEDGDGSVVNPEPLCQEVHEPDTQSQSDTVLPSTHVNLTATATVFASDKFRFDHSDLNHKDHISWLVSSGACQPDEKDMPHHRFPQSAVKATKSRRASTRHFCSSYYFSSNSLEERVKHTWLAYSFRGDYCYCHACWLFGDLQAQSSTWVSGVSDWQHLSKSIDVHLKSKQHRHCVGAYATYAAGNSVDAEMRKVMLAEEQKWQHVLTQQFSLLRLITGLGLPLRGHRETADSANPGIYLSLLQFISNTDTVLAHHLASSSRIKYASKTIMEEQIRVLANEVRRILVSECKTAKFYTVIADSSPDISHKDQMAVLLRYVAINRDQRSVCIYERFVGYFHVTDGTAAGICSLIEKVLFEDCNLEHKYLTGQAYDGASVMSGKTGGVQAVMRDRLKEKGNMFVPYVHCPPHQLNLVLVHAAESGHPMPPVQVRQFFDVVQSVYNYFSCSYRRWHLLTLQSQSARGFPNIVDDDCQTQSVNVCERDESESHSVQNHDPAQSAQPRTLKSLSQTRWSARKDATSALLANFGSVLESLAVLIDDKHDADEVKQAYDLQRQLDWTFLMTLTWWNDVLLIIDSASRLLQAKSNDLFMVVECFRHNAAQIEELRNDDKFKEYLKQTSEMWLALGFPAEEATFKEIRIRRKKRMADELVRDEVPASQEDRYRTDVYFRVLDNMVGEIKSRGEGLRDVCDLFGFLHSHYMSNISHGDAAQYVDKLCTRFPELFTYELADEIIAFQTLYFHVNAAKTVKTTSSPINYLQFIVSGELSDSFPQLEVLLRLFITLPIGISSAERSFSVLRRVKNYLRSTMEQQRTSDLALLSIERDVAEQLDIDSIIRDFARCKVRRGCRVSQQ